MKSKRWVFIFSIAGLALAFENYWKHAYFSFDVSMYMVAAKQILGGARPYVEIIDINPPLVLYIHIFIVWLSELLRIRPLEFYDLTLLLANIGFAFFISRKLKALGESARYAALGFLVASLHALIALQYGQREHLYVTFLLPYFCWRWVDDSIRSPAFHFVTFMTGLLAFLKPGFLAVLVTYEIFLFLYRRKTLVGHWLLLSSPGLVYLGHFLFLPKEVSDGFWVDLVPLVLSRYGTMGLSVTELLDWWGGTVLSYALLASLFLALGYKSRDQRFAILMPVGVCSFVALISAVMQGKGWEYHLIPAQFLLFFGFPIAIHALHQYLPAKIKLTALGLLLFSLLGKHLYFNISRAPSEFKRFSEVCGNDELKSLAPKGSSILVFSIHPCFSYPVFYERGYVPGTRYVSLYPLAFFNFTPERLEMFKSRFPTESDFSIDEKKFVDRVKMDLKIKKPDFIVFPKQLVPEGFDPYRYALSTGIFSQNTTGYKLIQDNDRWRIYRLF